MLQSYFEFIAGLPESKRIVFLLFLGFFFILFVFRWVFTGRLLFVRASEKKEDKEVPISLLTVIRNEEENIKNRFEQILKGQNGNFEWVFVDDYSQDNSYSELGLLRKKYKNVVLSSLPQETRYSYKLAQNIALKAAGNDWVMPVPAAFNVPDDFVKNLNVCLDNGKNVLVQFSNVERQKSFFNLLYRIEKFFLQIRSMGFIRAGLPFVYFEENVAFKKSRYFDLSGFSGKMNEPYANLELVINAFVSREEVHCIISPDTVISEVKDIAAKDYIELLYKNFRIEKNLSVSKRMVLNVHAFMRFLYIPFLLLMIISFSKIYLFFIALILLRILNDLFIIKMLQNRLNQRNLFISSLVYEMVCPYIKFFFRIRALWQNRK